MIIMSSNRTPNSKFGDFRSSEYRRGRRWGPFTTGGGHWPSSSHGGGAELAQGTVCLWERSGGGLKIKKKGGGGRMGEREWVEVGGWMGLGQFCVVMTTSCAIRTHSVTIRTTQGSCRVSAKQPRWGNLRKQANQSDTEGTDWWADQLPTTCNQGSCRTWDDTACHTYHLTRTHTFIPTKIWFISWFASEMWTRCYVSGWNIIW